MPFSEIVWLLTLLIRVKFYGPSPRLLGSVDSEDHYDVFAIGVDVRKLTLNKVRAEMPCGQIKYFFVLLYVIGMFSQASAFFGKKPQVVSITKSIAVDVKKELVWSALTDEKELSTWWNKSVRLEPRVGGEFYEPWGDGQLATGKVLAVKLQEYIKFTWQEKYWEPSQETICVFSIKDTSGKTTLMVLHSGWETFPEVNQEKLVSSFNKGWDSLMLKLKKYLDEKKRQAQVNEKMAGMKWKE